LVTETCVAQKFHVCILHSKISINREAFDIHVLRFIREMRTCLRIELDTERKYLTTKHIKQGHLIILQESFEKCLGVHI
jgi:hypothetical protein